MLPFDFLLDFLCFSLKLLFILNLVLFQLLDLIFQLTILFYQFTFRDL